MSPAILRPQHSRAAQAIAICRYVQTHLRRSLADGMRNYRAIPIHLTNTPKVLMRVSHQNDALHRDLLSSLIYERSPDTANKLRFVVITVSIAIILRGTGYSLLRM